MGQRFGECLICGAPNRSYKTALVLYLGVEVVVCYGECEQAFDARLAVAVQGIAAECQAARSEGKKAHGGKLLK